MGNYIYTTYIDPTPSVLDTKYWGKEFTKEDINNKEVFDIVEVYKGVNVGMYAYGYKSAHIARKAAEIIKENDNWTMVIPQGFGNGGQAHVNIYDKNNNLSYTLSWPERHIEDKICLRSGNKHYYYTDLSQVDAYFDMRKEIAQSKCACQNDS